MKNTLALLLLLTCSCVSSKKIALGEKFEPRPKDHPIAIYLPESSSVELLEIVPLLREKGNTVVVMRPGDAPPAAMRVGRIDAEAKDFAGWKDAVWIAQRDARKLGGDALLILDADGPWTKLGAFVLRYE